MSPFQPAGAPAPVRRTPPRARALSLPVPFDRHCRPNSVAPWQQSDSVQASLSNQLVIYGMTTVASGLTHAVPGEHGVAMRNTPGSGFWTPIRLISVPPEYLTVHAQI